MIPEPNCRFGYDVQQVEDILGARVHGHFLRWMTGQTMAICDGRSYSHEEKAYHATDCGPHGVVVYPWDLERYLAGRPVAD